MKLQFVLLMLLPLLALTTQHPVADPPTTPAGFDEGFEDDIAPSSSLDLTTSLVQSLYSSSFIQERFRRLGALIDLKTRAAKIVASLMTREHFIILRNILDLISRTCQFFMYYLPEADQPAGPGLLAGLFPVVPFDGSDATSTKPVENSNGVESDDPLVTNRVTRKIDPPRNGIARSKETESNLKKIEDKVPQTPDKKTGSNQSGPTSSDRKIDWNRVRERIPKASKLTKEEEKLLDNNYENVLDLHKLLNHSPQVRSL